MKSPLKGILIFIIIVIVIGIGYVYFTRGAQAQGSTSGLTSTGGRATGVAGLAQTDQAGSGTDIGREFLTSLLNLKTLTLSDKLFTNSSFQTLEDFSIAIIPPNDPGRPNPFAPVSGSVVGVNDGTIIPSLGGLIEAVPPPTN
jgi:hypothetical protein